MPTQTRFPALGATGWFWTLTAIAILLAGALSRALTATPSPRTGLAVAGTGILLAAVLTQAARLMLALVRAAPAQARTGPRPAPQDISTTPAPNGPSTPVPPPTVR